MDATFVTVYVYKKWVHHQQNILGNDIFDT